MPATPPEIQPPQPGDPAPWFTVASAQRPDFRFHSLGGRTILLVFAGPPGSPTLAAALREIEPLLQEGVLDDRRAIALLVAPGPRGTDFPPDRIPGLRVTADPQAAAHAGYGLLRRDADGGTVRLMGAAFLIDPQLRVIAAAPLDRLGALAAMLRGLPTGQEVPAPVLLLPRIFEPGLCGQLIAHYAQHGGEDSGFMEERDGRTIAVMNHGLKRRQDCHIQDPALQAAIRLRLVRRLLPEIRKAFQFEATRIERYVIACYDAASGGHFAAHRDNTTPGTAHRRFAVSINLNEDFEGGELWFPEFGPRRYRPPAGGAVVFSCSLLHEATPVTRGTRYAVLPFLYDEAAARIREANAGTIDTAGLPEGAGER